MRIETPEAGQPKDYLRTLDFESGEIKVIGPATAAIGCGRPLYPGPTMSPSSI